MNKLRIAALATTVGMALGSISANATATPFPDITAAGQASAFVNISAAGNSSFSSVYDFSLSAPSSLSVSVGAQLLQASNNYSGLKSVTETLSYLTQAGSWQTVWSSTSNTPGRFWSAGTTSPLDVKGGDYKLVLSGSTLSGSTYKGTYGYQISVSPVPEPETYALMGFGLTVLLLRRKQKRSSTGFQLSV